MNRPLAFVFVTLLALGGALPALADASTAPAATPAGQTAKDIHQDKKSIVKTKSQRRQATRQLNRDKAAGNTAGAKAQRQAVKGDTKTIAQDKGAIHNARKTRRQSKAAATATGGTGGK
jgi:hypothetical protein